MRLIVTHGVVLTGGAQAFRVAVTFVSGVLMARLLTPNDFGLVAMATTFSAFVSLLYDLGLGQAALQREHLSNDQLGSLFWLSLAVSLICATLFAVSAPLIADFFGEPRLVALILVFSLLVVIGGIQVQPFLIFNRQMRFRLLAGIDATAAVISAVTSLAVAWATSSYWALIIGPCVSTTFTAVAGWAFCRWRPGPPRFPGNIRDIVRLGTELSGFNVMNYFARNADNLLIGRFYGAEQLGLYDRAYRLLLFPLSQIQNPLGRVMLPLLASLRSDPQRYRNAYLECISLMMIVAQPGFVFLIVRANDIVLLILGPQWVPAAPIFRWLCYAGLLQIVTVTANWLFLSQGRGGDLLRLGIFNSVTTVIAFAIGMPWGPLGVAVAYAISEYVIRLPVTIRSAGRVGPVNTVHLLATGLPHLVACIVTGGTLVWLSELYQARTPLFSGDLLLISYASYGLVMLAFPGKRRLITQNLDSLIQLVARWRRA